MLTASSTFRKSALQHGSRCFNSSRSGMITGFRTFSSEPEDPLPNPTDDVDIEVETPKPAECKENILRSTLRPTDVVKELNRHIVGQNNAKRAVAVAMRNRWRRRQLPKELMKEVTPRNVLMIGPTGCGKTEVARRMAELSDAPFIKVEATKFTEVGYHGRDVDQIVRDLMDISMNLTKKKKTDELREEAKLLVEDRILDLLIGSPSTTPSETQKGRGRDSFRDMLRQGLLDEQEVEIEVPESSPDKSNGVFLSGDQSNPNVAAMTEFLSRMSSGGGAISKKGSPTERKRLAISEARDVILEVELDRLLEKIDLKKEAVLAVEQSGIVFIDEIDKICSSKDFMTKSADASAEGVQRDLLPLVEGTTISTKYGNVNTDYILFIASGAFHAVKPSDMLPELQGRLPIRVELNGLTEDDLYKILTEPVANLLCQQVELIATEGVNLVFEDEAVREIARTAALLNRTVENIGARRLHTVIERIMEIISFEAAEMEEGTTQNVDKELVEGRLSDVLVSNDLSRYIL
uniref:AAA+ ATPase domain-containing protein n=1 Tax=Eucampia antarctica TaxID=49252 RepID=A0A7S2RAH1_9STRA|mmetsp:Transcript_19520/g.18725  ORF Transcript_19520/g.18725 Transcript_19520/m.18725 type:complete len:521 (+) Transcript_19520:51-1613(+)|eukprot:CAMPEP_0197827666 /NCGR_PEP_ID=MMETSP1437-20131217/4396_1 /TAXON_ID=49252 ORGANISM="Eucampia antarctica, Strain CCMP1452" /NCGR_SAMPLE_ID=MMETSP1437 /ASSEMBLY_ACC=CAM_ASM_001096 /LENGTH=520 /DNA_ID=CAMNT_0043428605 /DNA_START=51 /DNA_END=1613 /DNA_ORIENTATION=+